MRVVVKQWLFYVDFKGDSGLFLSNTASASLASGSCLTSEEVELCCASAGTGSDSAVLSGWDANLRNNFRKGKTFCQTLTKWMKFQISYAWCRNSCGSSVTSSGSSAASSTFKIQRRLHFVLFFKVTKSNKATYHRIQGMHPNLVVESRQTDCRIDWETAVGPRQQPREQQKSK